MTNLPSRDAVLAAYLELMRDRPLSDVSMHRLAAALDISLADLRRVVSSEEALWWAYAEMVDLGVLAQADRISGTPRERVRQALKLRIKFLVPLRHAIAALIGEARHDAKLVETFHRISVSEQTWMLVAAGLKFRGPAARAAVEGLIGAFGATVGGWLSVEDPEAAMVAALQGLDRALDNGAGWLSGLEIDPAA
jgi:AcrR family transcriptional regulator